MLFDNIWYIFQEISISQEIAIASLSVISILVIYLIWEKSNRNTILAPFPPGPKGYSIIGSIDLERISKFNNLYLNLLLFMESI